MKTQPRTHTYQTLLLVGCSLAFACYFASYMRIPVVPLFANSLGATPVEVGLINAAFLLMAGLLSFPMGILSDYWGRKILVCGGLAISLLTALLTYVSRTPGQLIWIYLLFGVGMAAVGPTLMTFVADISPSTHLGRSYGWYTMAIYTGMSLGPGAGGWLAYSLGMRPLFLITAALLFGVIWLVIYFLPAGKGSGAGAHPASPPPRRSLTLREIAGNRALLGCWLMALGSCFGQGMFLTFVPLYAHEQGLNVGQVGLVFAVQAVCNALSRLPFGRLSDRMARRGRLAALGFVGFGAALAGFGLSHTLTQFLWAAAALGAFMGLAFTPLGALIAETVPPQSRGLAMGGYNTCIYLGMTLSSACMGGVIHRWGYPLSFLSVTVTTIMVTAWFYLLVKDFSPGSSD